MKKAFLAGVLGAFALGMVSCGGGHGSCDAYRKSDYTKYKEVKSQEMGITKIFTVVKKNTK